MDLNMQKPPRRGRLNELAELGIPEIPNEWRAPALQVMTDRGLETAQTDQVEIVFVADVANETGDLSQSLLVQGAGAVSSIDQDETLLNAQSTDAVHAEPNCQSQPMGGKAGGRHTRKPL